MSDAAPGPLDTSLLFDVFSVNQAVGRLLDETMRDGPLSPTEYATYSAIFELEAATPTQLAARLGMRLTTFMDKLRAADARGHARRLPNPSDRRSYRVVLTATGLEAHRAANRLFERAFEAFSRRLAADAPAAREGLREIRRAAEAATRDLAGVGEPRDAPSGSGDEDRVGVASPRRPADRAG